MNKLIARTFSPLLIAALASAVLVGACSTTATAPRASAVPAFKPADSLVLVTGITGTQGGGVARALLDKGFKLRGLTRDPDAARARVWSDRGVAMVKGDFNDHASIEAALQGVDFLFVNIVERVSDFLNEAKFTFDAAHRAGVKHIVLTTARLADPESGFEANADRSKRVLELYLRKSGYSYTTLRVPQMMENFIRQADMQRALTQGVMSGGAGTTLNHFFATYDMGLVTAAAFSNPAKWNGREVNLSADPLTGAQVAALLSKLSGIQIKHTVVPFEQAAGPTNTNARFYAEHDLPYDTAALKKEFPEIMTLEQFLLQNNYGEKLRAVAAQIAAGTLPNTPPPANPPPGGAPARGGGPGR